MIRYKEFENYLKEEELSINTINSYLFNLKKYEQYYGDDFSKDKIVDFKWKMQEKVKVKTVNHYIVAIKKYCKFIQQPCDVKKIKEQKTNSIENVISLEQFTLLIDNLKKEGKERYADYFLIPAKTGARISEFLSFTKQDLDNGQKVLYTKGKVRTILFPSGLLKELEGHFDGMGPDEKIYVNRQGQPMTARGFNSLFKSYAQKYGIPLEVAHAHGLRHLFAKEFLKRNSNIALLADILGHSGVNTTMIYTRESKEEQKRKLDDTVDW